jgi:drug/metabolite transporter (DMT)-like permease
VSSLLPYLYSAPTGLIPCPTLSIVIGLAVALRGLGSRTWSLVLCATAIFYGVYGAAHLGVTLDWVLLLGALMLVLTVVARRSAGEEGAFK